MWLIVILRPQRLICMPTLVLGVISAMVLRSVTVSTTSTERSRPGLTCFGRNCWPVPAATPTSSCSTSDPARSVTIRSCVQNVGGVSSASPGMLIFGELATSSKLANLGHRPELGGPTSHRRNSKHSSFWPTASATWHRQTDDSPRSNLLIRNLSRASGPGISAIWTSDVQRVRDSLPRPRGWPRRPHRARPGDAGINERSDGARLIRSTFQYLPSPPRVPRTII